MSIIICLLIGHRIGWGEYWKSGWRAMNEHRGAWTYCRRCGKCLHPWEFFCVRAKDPSFETQDDLQGGLWPYNFSTSKPSKEKK